MPSLHRLFRAAGLETPDNLQKIGKVTLTSQAEGSLFKPKLNSRLQAAGADIQLAGTVSALPVIGGIDLRLTAKHSNLQRLLQALNIDYRPSGRLGALDVTADIKGDAGNIAVPNLKAKIGKLDINGSVSLNLKGTRPMLGADLTTGSIVIDRFLPAQRRASLRLHRFAAWRAPLYTGVSPALLHKVARRKSGSQGRWSTDPIDLSGLRALDANVSLKAPL